MSTPPGPRRRLYPLAAGLIAAWAAGLVVLAATVLSGADLYFFSYYSIDYSLGFVRRGLGGEVLGLFGDYFGGMRVLRWVSTATYAAALLAVMWTVWTHFGVTQRRRMLALLLPVLPFGVVFALYSARPDLYGGAALAVLAVVLARTRSRRTAQVACAAYGLVGVVAALIHEAVPVEFALGAVLAIATLPRTLPTPARRAGVLMAVLPGLLATAAVALAGRRGISAALCEQIPVRHIENPYALEQSPQGVIDFLTGRNRPFTEYNGWMCRNILPMWDLSPGQAVRYVLGLGVGQLIASAVFGAVVVAVTLAVLRRASNVPFAEFRAALRGWGWWTAAAGALMLPLFLTAYDWTRWMIIIGMNIALVYLLFAAGRPQAEAPADRRTVVVCATAGMLFALIPVGIVAGFAVQPPI
ncbi:hypothetical protein A5757_11460 [Mycobacterium sp. 852013-51886_SCH5428379]|uniref:hypothetical protein n=1 Tax=Mycobacterium sp. 852013-51886_SCH5428379 TaxID=1834111 RepID=UPI0007FD18E1|nr:hypothetical protein [Mycobacterium sp. 852013-51886_SCH5428379]OBB59705.1 hypothetical protein A5757_11460 [Mycobacterium sp. 852013-51886_SCH5428379]